MSVTTRSRTTRRRRETPTRRSTVLKAFATIGVILAFLGFAITANKGVPGRDYATMYVTAPATGSLRAHDKVAIGGVRVGQVVHISAEPKGARVKLQIEPGVALPADSRVVLRANGLLGARYVQLVPGSARRMLPDGATIRGGQDALTATVPDALDVFDAQTRGALGTAVSGLGQGVLGNGDRLNDGVRVASRATVPFSSIMDSILARPGGAERLVPGLDSGVGALNDSRSELRALFAPTAQALRPFGARAADIRSTLDVAPSALAAATTGLQHGSTLLTAADALAVSAHRTLPAAPAGLRQATALLREARTDAGGGSPLERTTKLLGAAAPAVPAVLKITGALKPVLPRLDDGLTNLSPILQYVGRYGCDVINTGVILRSMTGFVGTGTGPNGPSSQFRLQAVAGTEALGVKEVKQIHDAYHAPCKYLAHPFDLTPGTGLNLGGGR